MVVNCDVILIHRFYMVWGATRFYFTSFGRR